VPTGVVVLVVNIGADGLTKMGILILPPQEMEVAVRVYAPGVTFAVVLMVAVVVGVLVPIVKDPVAGVGVIVQLVPFIEALGPIENELATAGVKQLEVAGVIVIALVKVRRI
jgi:hypothetical protein